MLGVMGRLDPRSEVSFPSAAAAAGTPLGAGLSSFFFPASLPFLGERAGPRDARTERGNSRIAIVGSGGIDCAMLGEVGGWRLDKRRCFWRRGEMVRGTDGIVGCKEGRLWMRWSL